MPIQVLGLRDFFNKKTGKKQKTTRFYNKGWGFPKIEDVFVEGNILQLLKNVPEDDQWNLYFTVADCLAEREMTFQEAIPFDVDWVELVSDTVEEKCAVTLKARSILAELIPGAAPQNVAALWSGHGIQLFVLIEDQILSKSDFLVYQNDYKRLCVEFSRKLKEAGVIHRDVDTTVFSAARIMRLPFTINRKENCEDTRSFLVGEYAAHRFPMFLKKEQEKKEHIIHDSVLKTYLKPDTKGVVAECHFLNWCKDNQEEVTEPQWYSMLSVVARLDEGPKLCHEYSNKYSRYNEHETDTKIQQALDAAGPRTCEGIDSIWGKCSGCPHYQSSEIRSPIQIKSADYIATEATGFRPIVMDENGRAKKGPISYSDMVKAYNRDHKYKSQVVGNGRNGVLHWIYTDDHWKRIHEGGIAQWVEKVTKGDVKTHEVLEFINKLARNNPISTNFFEDAKSKYKQFRNCVLDLSTGEMYPPSPEFGITHVVPHVYNKDMKCPQWDQFLMDVTENDEEKVKTLNEYIGYCLFSASSWLQKALALVGDGANGKSVFMHIVKELIGAENSASIKIKNIGKEDSIAQLGGKLVNICGEVSYDAFRDSADFKELVEGGTFTGRLQYEVPRDVIIHTKFIMACNEVPRVYDQSKGFARRLLVARFDREFTPETEGHDPFIKEKLEREIPGIINRVSDSYKDLLKRGYFDAPPNMEEEKDAFLNSSNGVTEFVNEYFEKGEKEDFLENSHIRQMADQYAEIMNVDPRMFTAKRIAAEFRRKFKIKTSCTRKIKGKVSRGYLGVRPKPDTDIEIEDNF